MSEIPWLLLLYSLPAASSSARVGIWRKVKKTGALPFKSSSYLLPNRPDLLERFQWLAQQIQESGGEATVVLVSELEGISQEKMARQFNDARAADYDELIASLNELISRGKKTREDAQLTELDKLRRRFAEIRSLDYFGCPLADKAAMLLEKAMEPPAGKIRKGGKNTMPVLSPQRFTGKVWLTRPQPAIDRVFKGWARLGVADEEIFQRGFTCFDALYAFLKSKS